MPAGQSLRCPPAHHKMQDQRNYRQYEQQVDQSSRHVKYRKAANPSNQQNYKQDRPDTHVFLLRFSKFGSEKAVRRYQPNLTDACPCKLSFRSELFLLPGKIVPEPGCRHPELSQLSLTNTQAESCSKTNRMADCVGNYLAAGSLTGNRKQIRSQTSKN